MITKEYNFKKYCCFYVSDFHLEMILLPYIKQNLDKSKIIICTENNLSNSINLLLERINLKEEEKNKILKLNWSNNNSEEIDDIYTENEILFIIVGNYAYINRINSRLEKIQVNKCSVIDCYNISEDDMKILKIKDQYEGILNTKKL